MDFVFYILLTLFFTSATLSVIFYMAWSQMGRKTFVLLWAITFAIAAVQRLGNIFKDNFPSYDLYWMVVCILSILTVSFGTQGHVQRVGANVSKPLLYGSGLLTVLATFWFTYIQPHTGLRMSIYLFHNVVFLFYVAWLVVRFRRRPLLAEWGASVSYLSLAVFQLVAAIVALMQGAQPDDSLLQWYAVINFTTLPASFIAMGLFVVFILASDMAEEMKELATTDSLTPCLNRRGFYEKAKNLIDSLSVKNQPAYLLYWDIDKFKRINDTYGHAAGDKVLVESCTRVLNAIKVDDLFGRFGGEEFVVLCPNTTREQAEVIAERLRHVVDDEPIVTEKGEIDVTISIGVAELDQSSFCLEQLLKKADEALYSAKETGRNKVVFAPS